MIDTDRIRRETFVASVEHHATIGSTNDRAVERSQSATDLPLLVLADMQTAGRGRGANRWWTGPGALAFSLLLDANTLSATGGHSAMSALAAAVAVADSVAPLLPQREIGIHWPNDVTAAGLKIAGILVEVLPDRKHVVGIGLNANNTLADAPDELRDKAATLRDLAGRVFDPIDLLIDLLRRLDSEFARLRSSPEQVASRAEQYCLQRGCALTLEWDRRSVAGVCRGIAPDGALLLETGRGVEPFHSGVVRNALPEAGR